MANLRQKILVFCQSYMGQKVGDGECWTFVFEALKSSNAKTPHDFGSIYKWSNKKVSLADAKPGDIFQFKKFKVSYQLTEKGQSGVLDGWFQLGFPRHTSVFKKITNTGKYDVFEQNVGDPPKKKVQISSYFLKKGSYVIDGDKYKVTHVSGSLTIYRAQPLSVTAALMWPNRNRDSVWVRSGGLQTSPRRGVII